MSRVAQIACAAVFALGCAESKTSICGDLICPIGTVCSPSHEGCFEPDQVEACRSEIDGAVCSYSDVAGSCDRGVCFPLVCGDDILVAPEQCEDENFSGLSCLAFGFYEPAGLACNSDCTIDTAQCVGRCGDGEVNGPELCDTLPGDVFTCFETGFDYGAVRCSDQLCAPLYDDCVRFGWSESPHPYDFIGDAFARDNGDLLLPGGSEYTLVNRFEQRRVPLPNGCAADQVWGSTDAVYVSCFDNADSTASVIRHQGDVFDEFAVAGIGRISDVWGFGDDDIYAVGDGVARFDGATWSTIADPALAGISFDSIDGRASKLALIGNGSTLAVLDGGTWTSQTLPPNSLRDVAVTGDGTVFALGDGALWYDDGANWVSTIPTNAGSLRSIHALGQSSIYAYGTGGTLGEAVWRFDGQDWIELDTPRNFFETMVGSNNHLALIYPYGSFYDSSGYGFTPQPTRASEDLLDVWVFAPDSAIAIGARIDYRWDGTSWTESALPIFMPSARMWASAPNNIVAISVNGDFLRFNGTQWINETPVFNTGNPRSIAGTAADSIFVLTRVSFDIKVFHYNGTAWSEVFVIPGGFGTEMWADPARGTYFAASGKLYHNAPGAPPTTWTELDLPATGFTSGMWGDDDELIVTFASGSAFRLLPDNTWQEIETRLRTAPARLSGTEDDLFGISPEGIVRVANGSWDRVRVPSLANDSPNAVFAGEGGIAIVGENGFAGFLVRP